jgi:pantoate--beta-alanine ligase
MRKIISSKKNIRIDYIKAVETNELKPISEIRGEVLIAIACHFRKVRLIDNIIVKM